MWMVLPNRLQLRLMKLRSFFTALLVLVLGFLLAGLGGAYWIWAQSPIPLLNGGVEGVPTAAMFIPKQAPFVVSLLVHPDRLDAVRQLTARPSQRRQAEAELAQLKQGLLTNLDLDYDRDIQPWLGSEVTVALTTPDLDRDRSNGEQPGYLITLAASHPKQAREFLELYWQKQAIAGRDLSFEPYKGATLIYGNEIDTPATSPKNQAGLTALIPARSLATAVVGERFVLLANHPKVLRDAITNVQAPNLSLSSTSFYQQALTSLPQPRLGMSFINLPLATTWVTHAPTQPAHPTYQTLAVSFALHPQGIVADTALSVPAELEPALASQTTPSAGLQYLPNFTAIALSGQDLGHLWGTLSQTLGSYGDRVNLLSKPLADLQQQWGLNLANDVFRWVTGDYAIGLLPPAIDPNLPPPPKRPTLPASFPPSDWVFVAQKTADTEAGVAHLDALAKQQGLSVGIFQLQGQSVYAWTRLINTSGDSLLARTLQTEVRGVHASVGDYEIFTTSLPAMDQVLRSVSTSLLSSDRFQQAILPLRQPNQGSVYLDWTNSRPLLEQEIPFLKVLELTAPPVFNHLKTLTLSSYGVEGPIQRGGLFMALE